MSLAILATGTLVRDPEPRQSRAGKPYATALLRVPTDGEEAVLVSLIAFTADAVDALLAHAKGDTVAVTGRGKLTTWEKDGERRHGLSVTVEGLLSPYQRRSRARGDAGGDAGTRADRAHSAELERMARAQASQGKAQLLTTPAGGIAEMADDPPF